GGRIEFSPGRYDFRLDRAIEKYLFVSNNDEGLKRIAFHLEGLSEVEIDGQGAEFIFHGFLMPFAVENCRGVTLRNFSIDYARPFHSEGEILKVEQDVAKGAEGLVFERNTHEQSDAYPPCRMAASPFLLEHCSQVRSAACSDAHPSLSSS
ncbi:MAG: hypothetical protein ACK49N_10095, partial [Verrucomicrobiota bacterium]